MELTPEQQKALEEQKANCIFCQIIEGKIPSKQVFSDDKLTGLLDINPASKGHVLLMPKEHYPIMPLIPPDTFKQMCRKTRAVDVCIKEALLSDQNTIFIANGGAAGQQSQHFMLHIIPREKGDELPFDTEGSKTSEEERHEMIQKTAHILRAMLNKNLAIHGYIKPQGKTGTTEKVSKEQVLQLINANPQIKQIILEKPDTFRQIVPEHPQLKQLFEGHDLDSIIATVKRQSEPKEGRKLSLGLKGGKQDE